MNDRMAHGELTIFADKGVEAYNVFILKVSPNRAL
jgi:hypothetical protein